MSNYIEQIKQAQEQVNQAVENLRITFSNILANNPATVSFTKVNNIYIVDEETETTGADWGDYDVVTSFDCIVETDTCSFAISVTGEVGEYYGYTVSEWTLPQMDKDSVLLLHEALIEHARNVYGNVGMAKSFHYAVGLITEDQYEADHDDFDIEV